MRMNRRNVLVGLGTIVAGGGAALGTGAFSSVDAERDVKISVADDSDALLGLTVEEDSEFVSDSGGILSIELSNANLNATTTIADAFSISNNSGETEGADFQDITVSAEITEPGDVTHDAIRFEVEDDGDEKNILNDSIDLTETDDSILVSIVIDTTDDDFEGGDELAEVITFTANPTSN